MATAGHAARVLTRRAATGATAYVPRRYRATPVPSTRQRHMLNRMGCGFSPQAYRQLLAAGGELQWFEQQLDPESVPESSQARALPGWFPRLQESPATKWANNLSDAYPAWEYARDLANYSMLRRVYSTRSVLESMVEFWGNHLHVEARNFPGFTTRAAYDATIREHALGRFEDLLVAASLHPAMLMFLDNWKSVRNAPNENHGRELLELHTVGRDAAYTEAMVKDSANILSGWTVRQDDWTAYFDPKRHTTGTVKVLEFTDPNATADNPGLAERYLRYLANHPATAARVARRLAVRFVSDNPPAALVDRVARAYLDSGTDIKAALRALVAGEEFWSSVGRKTRTPIDDVVATCRVLQVKAGAPTGGRSFANELVWVVDSVLPFHWPRPDGPPESAAVWASPTRMLNSWHMHWLMAGGWYPNGEVTFQPPTRFLPAESIRFDRLVDHLSRVLLGRTSTARMLQAACEGCAVAPGERITGAHPVMSYKFPRVVAVLLDSPAHMTR